jgi:hypothetical protein
MSISTVSEHRARLVGLTTQTRKRKRRSSKMKMEHEVAAEATFTMKLTAKCCRTSWI